MMENGKGKMEDGKWILPPSPFPLPQMIPLLSTSPLK